MSELAVRKVVGYGWKRDLPDHRDLMFAAEPSVSTAAAGIPVFDLSKDKAMPLVWDQGQLGSCTAHSVGAAWSFATRKLGGVKSKPARLWIYYQERVIEGTVNEDSGASIRDGFKVIATLGVPSETYWPYSVSTFANPPSAAEVKVAAKHKASVYRSVTQSLNDLKSAIYGGFPVSFGFSVYDSFESSIVAKTGIVPMPGSSERMVGGHAVLLTGWDDTAKTFKVRNSWGTGWGQKGYFTMPYNYVLDPNLADDFWQVTVSK